MKSQIFSERLKKIFPSPPASMHATGGSVFTMAALSVAANRFLYGLLYPLIARYKETAPPEDVSVGVLSRFQSALGCRVYPSREDDFSARFSNGMKLCQGLRDCAGIGIVDVRACDRPVFNRFPLMCYDQDMRQRIQDALWRSGIESSRMYLRPLHHMFKLGYSPEAFPHAVMLAERLLTVPVHQRVTANDIDTMITCIRVVTRSTI